MTSINRRGFIAGCSAFALGGCRSLFTGGTKAFDDNLMVFISDVHVRPGERNEKWQQAKLMVHIAEILRMDPLPRNVLCFGDLAYSYGVKEDYEVFKKLVVDTLEATGIKVTLAMGNHDRRDAFLEVFPEYAEKCPVKGRIDSVVETPNAVFALLDTLDDRPYEPGAVGRNKVEGDFSAAQSEWFSAFAAKTTKPLFAGGHHPAREMSNLSAALADAPTCYGWVHGHNHRFYEYFASDRYMTTHTLRTIGLPSTGHWGDIGYGIFRTGPDRAILTCRQTEFFFPKPFAAERILENWKEVTRDHDGRRIVFHYDK